MNYCLNPSCSKPKNPDRAKICEACGSKLLLRDRYRILGALGHGGFGATFLVQDIYLPGKPYSVIKQLRPNSTNPNMFQVAKKLFEREAETMGKIGHHPQIPRLLDYFEDNQRFYLVQEYVKGHNLQQEVAKKGPFTESDVKQFLNELLPILRDIHAQQVIHRDIKPANIIRRAQDGRLVLIDFGIVKNQVDRGEDAGTGNTALTQFAVGTPGFAPPEQLALRPVYSSDIYALGVTCVYLLTGKAPKDFESDPITGEINWSQHLDISHHLVEILEKMMEVSVRNRYKMAEEVIKAMEIQPYMQSLAQGMLTQPSPQKTPQQLASIANSNPAGKPNDLAQAIRDRRMRRGMNVVGSNMATQANTGINGAMTGIRSSVSPHTSIQGTIPPKPRTTTPTKPPKVDAETLKAYYARGRRDFTRYDFNFINLQKATLDDCTFNQAKFLKANLQGSDFSRGNFSQADLRQAILKDAKLGRAYLGGANLEGADLRGADLSHANLKDANLKGANLCGANLYHAILKEEQIVLAKTNWATVMPTGKRGFW
jgi:serine/threonine protein kinase, bacterial